MREKTKKAKKEKATRSDASSPSTTPTPRIDGRGDPIIPDAWYFVQDARPGSVVGNCASWWRPGGAGYTCDLNDAGVYRGAGLPSGRETDVPWPENYVRKHAVTHVRADGAALARRVARSSDESE